MILQGTHGWVKWVIVMVSFCSFDILVRILHFICICIFEKRSYCKRGSVDGFLACGDINHIIAIFPPCYELHLLTQTPLYVYYQILSYVLLHIQHYNNHTTSITYSRIKSINLKKKFELMILLIFTHLDWNSSSNMEPSHSI